MVIKETILQSNNDKFITISIKNEFDFDSSEAIADIVETEKINNTNIYKDYELIKFKPNTLIDIKFKDVNSNDLTYGDIGFNNGNVLFLDPKYNTSYWVMELYDSFIKNNQNKIYTNFYKPTQNTFTPTSTVTNNTPSASPLIVPLNKTDNSSNLFIPKRLITGSTSMSCYLKLRFFNAGTGELMLFKPSTSINSNSDSEENYYIKLSLDLNNFTYIVNNTYVPNSNSNLPSNLQLTQYINQLESEANGIITSNMLFTEENPTGEYITADGNYKTYTLL